jgi:hypothetical protein
VQLHLLIGHTDLLLLVSLRERERERDGAIVLCG